MKDVVQFLAIWLPLWTASYSLRRIRVLLGEEIKWWMP